MKNEITFDDFSKLDLRVGKVVKAENIKGADVLMRLTVDFGELGKRSVLSGIKKWYNPKDLQGKKYIFVYNLKPKKFMGEVSQGMIMAAETQSGEECVLLVPDKNITSGSKVH